MSCDSKHTEASFSPTRQISCTYELIGCLDLKIRRFFMDNDNDNNNNDTTDYFTPYTCAWGKNQQICRDYMFQNFQFCYHYRVISAGLHNCASFINSIYFEWILIAMRETTNRRLIKSKYLTAMLLYIIYIL